MYTVCFCWWDWRWVPLSLLLRVRVATWGLLKGDLGGADRLAGRADLGGAERALLRRELLPLASIRRFLSRIEERLGAATAYDGVLPVGADILAVRCDRRPIGCATTLLLENGSLIRACGAASLSSSYFRVKDNELVQRWDVLLLLIPGTTEYLVVRGLGGHDLLQSCQS